MAKAKPPLRLEYVDPNSLDDNKLNYKKHTQRQNAALNATLDANGWAGALLYNERTKKLIDGHGRKALAIKRGEKLVPVLVGSWTEEQERQLLATLDPIGQMAQINASALKSLTAGVQQNLDNFKGKGKESLSKLNADIHRYASSVESGEAPSVLLDRCRTTSSPEKERSDEELENGSSTITETSFKDDVIFELNSSPWDIPLLRSDVLCSVVPDRVWDRSPESTTSAAWYCYSAGPNTIPPAGEREGGILGFFTEDFRFEVAWNDSPTFTSRLLEMDFTGVCLPDYSQWDDWPAAVRLHNLYRSRWCGRYWQEAGIPVIPILQAMGDAEQYSHLIFDTLPAKPPVVAVQCRTSGASEPGYFESFTAFLKLAIAAVKPANIVIYGGLDNEKYLSGYLPRSKGTKITLLHSYLYARRYMKKGKKK